MIDRPGQESNTAAKKKKESGVKAKKRIKMPILMIIGIAVVFFGLIFTILPYFAFTATADDFEKDTSGVFKKYDSGDTAEVRGEITYKKKASDPNVDIWYYELDGDGEYWDPETGERFYGEGYFRDFVRDSRDDPDMMFYSEEDFADKGDSVFIVVLVEEETGSIQRVKYVENALAIKYFIFGPLFILVGAILFVVGFIGKKDSSLDEYLGSNPDLKKGEISISEYQKQQKMSQQKKGTAEDLYGPGVATTPGEAVAPTTPQAGQVSSTNPQAPAGQPMAPAGQPGAAQPMGQPGAAQPMGQPGAAQPMGQPGAAQPMGQPGAAQPMGQPGAAQPMGQPGAPPQQPVQPPPGQPLQPPPQ